MTQIYRTRWNNSESFIKAEDYDHALRLAQRYHFNEIVDIEPIPITREHFDSTHILPSSQLNFAMSKQSRHVDIDDEGIEHIAASVFRLIYYVTNLKEPIDNDVLAGIQIYRNHIPTDDEFPEFFEWIVKMEECVQERLITRNNYLGIEEDDGLDC